MSTMRPAGTAGFTLLETVVAMVILALVITTAGSTMRMIGMALGHQRESSYELAETTGLRGLVATILAQAVPLDWGDDDAFAASFEGTPRRVRFVTPAPPWQRIDGLVAWEISLEARSRDRSELLLRRVALATRDQRFAVLDEVPARRLAELEGGSIAYFGSPPSEDISDANESTDDTAADSEDAQEGSPEDANAGAEREPGAWYAAWPASAGLPKLVRIEGLDGVTGLPLLVEIPVDQPSWCATGGEGRGCTS